MNKFMKANQKIEKAVVSGYKAIEEGAISSYKAVENRFVGGYQKIEDQFVKSFLTPDEDAAQQADHAGADHPRTEKEKTDESDDREQP